MGNNALRRGVREREPMETVRASWLLSTSHPPTAHSLRLHTLAEQGAAPLSAFQGHEQTRNNHC